jgi:hypothetical protein
VVIKIGRVAVFFKQGHALQGINHFVNGRLVFGKRLMAFARPVIIRFLFCAGQYHHFLRNLLPISACSMASRQNSPCGRWWFSALSSQIVFANGKHIGNKLVFR